MTDGLGSDSALIASHKRIAPMSTNSVHRTINGAVHEDLISDEMDTKATSEAILDIASLIGNLRTLSR